MKIDLTEAFVPLTVNRRPTAFIIPVLELKRSSVKLLVLGDQETEILIILGSLILSLIRAISKEI